MMKYQFLEKLFSYVYSKEQPNQDLFGYMWRVEIILINKRKVLVIDKEYLEIRRDSPEEAVRLENLFQAFKKEKNYTVFELEGS